MLERNIVYLQGNIQPRGGFKERLYKEKGEQIV